MACGQRAGRDRQSGHRDRMNQRDPWDIKDPTHLLAQVDELCPLRAGQVVVAAVEIASQSVTDARVASLEPLPDEYPYGSHLVRGLAEVMVPERWSVTRDNGGMSHVLVTIVCREGRAFPGSGELAWWRAWRYANQQRGAFDGSVYVVTPHGWTGLSDERAGFEPRLTRPALALTTEI